MCILVTGGAGFIGSHLCEKLSQRHRVICLDNFDKYYSPNIKEANTLGFNDNISVVKADILDTKRLESIMRDENVKVVAHLAAQAGVRASLTDPVKTCNVNIGGTLNILESIRKSGVKRLVFASSSSVYGRIKYLPFDEGHPKDPVSPYGVSKLACEKYISAYENLYGLEYVALRYFTVYGPRIRPDLAIYSFTKNALEGKELRIYGDGTKSRDFTHVSDAVDATCKALEKGSGEYNIGGGTTVTVQELAEKIIGNVGSGRIKHVKDQKGEVLHTKSDTRKASKELGWMPGKNLDEGLSETIEWICQSAFGKTLGE